MANQAQTSEAVIDGPLPALYRQISALNPSMHGDLRLRRSGIFPRLAAEHAVPVITREFEMVQRHMPIVFTSGPKPVPIALMALKPNTNVFVAPDGVLRNADIYIPEYVRRCPFILGHARDKPGELALCFDPSSRLIGKFEDGDPLFANGEPTQVTRDIFELVRDFQKGAEDTDDFVELMIKHSLLRNAELAIETNASKGVLDGFLLVDERRLDKVRAATLQYFHQVGALELIYLHLASLKQLEQLGRRHVALGDFADEDAG
jgi:hypothetical protein